MDDRVIGVKTKGSRGRSWRCLPTLAVFGCLGLAGCFWLFPDQCLKQVGTLPITEVNALAISPKGDVLAAAGYKTVKLWDIHHRRLLRSFSAQNDTLLSLTFSPDGHLLATTAWGEENNDFSVQLWDVDTGQRLHALLGNKGLVLQTAFSPDSQVLATAGSDKTIRLWSARTGKLLRSSTGHKDQILALVFAPGGKQLASGSVDGTIRLWNVATGKLIRTIDDSYVNSYDNRTYNEEVMAIIFSGDGRLLQTIDMSHELRLWDLSTGKLKNREDLHDGPDCITVSRNGGAVAWSTPHRGLSDSGGVAVNLHQFCAKLVHCSLPREYSQVFSLALSPDGKLLAVGCSDGITLWTPTLDQK